MLVLRPTWLDGLSSKMMGLTYLERRGLGLIVTLLKYAMVLDLGEAFRAFILVSHYSFLKRIKANFVSTYIPRSMWPATSPVPHTRLYTNKLPTLPLFIFRWSIPLFLYIIIERGSTTNSNLAKSALVQQQNYGWHTPYIRIIGFYRSPSIAHSYPIVEQGQLFLLHLHIEPSV